MGDDRRWYDKLLGAAGVVIGALSAILWGIVWGQVSAHERRLNMLEGDKRVIEVRLEGIESLQKEIKTELREIKLQVEVIARGKKGD